MIKPNWRNADDYDYVTTLSDEALKWEFIRRSKTYRAAYEKMALQYLELHKNGENPPIVAYQPSRLPDETELTWAERAADLGISRRKLTPSMQEALRWNLRDMYDPLKPAESQGSMFLKKSNGVQIFWDTIPVNPDGDLIEGTELLGNDLITYISPLDEIAVQNLDDTLYVAFDLTKPWENQIKIVGKFFQVVKTQQLAERASKKHLTVSYLRMLDSFIEEPDLNNVVRYEVITGGYLQLDADQRANAAFKMKEAAEQWSEKYLRE